MSDDDKIVPFEGDADKPKRRGKAVKPKRGVPAEFQPGGAKAPRVFDEDGVAKKLHLYWEEGDGQTFIVGDDVEQVATKDGNGELVEERPRVWSRWPEKKVVNLLKQEFVRTKAREGEQLSECDRVIQHVMRRRRLDMSIGALAGYGAGIYLMRSKKVLVRSSPHLLVPKEGEWEFVKQLLHSKLDLSGMNGCNQVVYFHGWMKTALEGLYLGGPGNFRPGQALILAGGADSGKSRLQNQVMTEMLGGRSADPGPFLFGTTDFNAEMFEAEHLMMEDPASSVKMIDRVRFGELLKQLTVNDNQRLHAKREDAITVSPFFRMSISINDDPDKMRVLPPLTPDMKDKVILFHISSTPLPMKISSLADRAEFRRRISAELPAYAWWLMNEFSIPDNLKSDRFGVTHWHHPTLALELFDDTPAAELLTLIDAAEFKNVSDVSKRLWELESDWKDKDEDGNMVPGVWEGSVLELERLLLGEGSGLTSSVMREAKKLFLHNKIDRLLSRLKEDRDDRVAQHRTNLKRGWRIARP